MRYTYVDGKVLGVLVALQSREGLVTQLNHHVAMELEEHLRRRETSFLLDLLQHIICQHVHILQSTFSLQTQCQQRVGLCLSQFVLFYSLYGISAS